MNEIYLSKNIKYLRQELKLSLNELAQTINTHFGLNLSKGMISKWENSKAQPGLSNVRYLALFFKISSDDLIGKDLSIR